MTRPPTRYPGSHITFATMHGKEHLARDAFYDVLGTTVTAPRGLDTDQFGTFAGDIPRKWSAASPRNAPTATHPGSGKVDVEHGLGCSLPPVASQVSVGEGFHVLVTEFVHGSCVASVNF